MKDRDGRTLIDRDDPFDCRQWCGNGIDLLPDDLRAKRNCTLPGFYMPWKPLDYEAKVRLQVWQGAPKRVTPDGYIDPRPAEPLEDGCPGGWARCGFASSFAKYIRPRVQGGGHDSNPRIGAGTPAHILDALQFFETYQAKAAAEFQRKAS